MFDDGEGFQVGLQIIPNSSFADSSDVNGLQDEIRKKNSWRPNCSLCGGFI
jgi:hypothetical protein